MKGNHKIGNNRRESGAALLIAIFALLLISVVAIALIVSSGTDSALARNYRTSTNAYYAALAGMEEARGRLLPTNPNYIPIPGTPMSLTQVIYIINPLNGETVAPWNTSNPATYPDNQYLQEFGVDVSTRLVTSYTSISPDPGASPALPGPSYKWVRINPVTEQSMGDGGPGVDVNSDGGVNAFITLFYNPVNVNGFNLSPGLIENATVPSTAGQALEITAYAVLPTGGQKMLQYIVRPLIVFPGLFLPRFPNGQQLPQFPAALTLAGNDVTFTGPGPGSFFINGQNPPACPGSPQAMPSIGYTNNSDSSFNNIKTGAMPVSNYLGAPVAPGPPPTPATAPASLGYVGNQLNPNWLTPSGLNAAVQMISNSADAVIQGPATPSSFPSGMSAAHPMTIVVNGNLDLTSWHSTGYGLLVVTGTLTYDPAATWEGVVLVIGQGSFVSTNSGPGGIDGAVFIAKTLDSSGNVLSTLGAASFSQTGSGRGINFNSCVAQTAQGPITYQVIAFKEIPLPN